MQEKAKSSKLSVNEGLQQFILQRTGPAYAIWCRKRGQTTDFLLYRKKSVVCPLFHQHLLLRLWKSSFFAENDWLAYNVHGGIEWLWFEEVSFDRYCTLGTIEQSSKVLVFLQR
jgi:hypothetical protein